MLSRRPGPASERRNEGSLQGSAGRDLLCSVCAVIDLSTSNAQAWLEARSCKIYLAYSRRLLRLCCSRPIYFFEGAGLARLD
jgi:hypothetical protein